MTIPDCEYHKASGKTGIYRTKGRDPYQERAGVSVRMNLREYIKERWLQFIMLLAVLTVVILFGVLVMIPTLPAAGRGLFCQHLVRGVVHGLYEKTPFLQDSGKSSGTS